MYATFAHAGHEHMSETATNYNGLMFTGVVILFVAVVLIAVSLRGKKKKHLRLENTKKRD